MIAIMYELWTRSDPIDPSTESETKNNSKLLPQKMCIKGVKLCLDILLWDEVIKAEYYYNNNGQGKCSINGHRASGLGLGLNPNQSNPSEELLSKSQLNHQITASHSTQISCQHRPCKIYLIWLGPVAPTAPNPRKINHMFRPLYT